MSKKQETKWIENKPIESCGDTIIISEQHVMHSAAGFYIGCLCKTVGGRFDGLIEPYNRLSDYMSYEQAVKLLQTINN